MASVSNYQIYYIDWLDRGLCEEDARHQAELDVLSEDAWMKNWSEKKDSDAILSDEEFLYPFREG